MQTIEFQQNRASGIPLFYRRWQATWPACPVVKAAICLVHGLGEHSGRYTHVAKFFTESGFALLGFDHQGHGRSGGKRGHAEGLASMLDDITVLLEMAASLHPGLPIFLYGHSMGGNLVLNHALRRKLNLTGVVATAPFIRQATPPPPLLVGFAKLASRFLPRLTQSNRLEISGLANDPAVIEAYRADPLVHDRISARLGAELLGGAAWLDAYSGPLPCPTLLMHGTDDPLTDPRGTADFAKRTTGDVTWRAWPGLKHEIHNEPQQAEVMAFTTDWMERFC